MGTHPIFESDFDCLTESRDWKCRSIRRDECWMVARPHGVAAIPDITGITETVRDTVKGADSGIIKSLIPVITETTTEPITIAVATMPDTTIPVATIEIGGPLDMMIMKRKMLKRRQNWHLWVILKSPFRTTEIRTRYWKHLRWSWHLKPLLK